MQERDGTEMSVSKRDALQMRGRGGRSDGAGTSVGIRCEARARVRAGMEARTSSPRGVRSSSELR